MGIFFLNPNPPFRNGCDVDAQYQMVPAGGVRHTALVVDDKETEDVLVFSDDPARASLFGLAAVKGSASIVGSGFRVKPDSAIRFFISGGLPGATTIRVETQGGRPRGFFLISVKPELRRTYQLGIVRDPVHVPDFKFAGANLAANMQGAERIWFNQANVRLTRVGPIVDCFVPFNIGDPILIDNPVIFDAVTKSALTKDFANANFFIFGTWDIVYSTNSGLAGSNTGNACFIENALNGLVGARICAHEMGHGLGLIHSEGTDLLMEGIVNGDFIDMRDIETVHRFAGFV